MIGDMLGSVAAVFAGVLIVLAGWMWTDPLSSVLISLIIRVNGHGYAEVGIS